jgi:hypothetical protein
MAPPPDGALLAAAYTIIQQCHGFTECNIRRGLSLVEPEWDAYGALPRRSVPSVEVLGAAAWPFPCRPASQGGGMDQGGAKDASGTGLCPRDPAGSRFPLLPGSHHPLHRLLHNGVEGSGMEGRQGLPSSPLPHSAPVRWPARACRCRLRGRPGCTGLARGAHTTGPPPASRGRGPPRERSDRSRMACVSPRRLIHTAHSGMPTHCCRPSPIGAGGTEHPGS